MSRHNQRLFGDCAIIGVRFFGEIGVVVVVVVIIFVIDQTIACAGAVIVAIVGGHVVMQLPAKQYPSQSR